MFLVLRALRRPVTVIVAALAILLGAALAVRNAPVDIFPDLRVPVIYVVQPYGGMSPSQMEGQLISYYEYHFLYIAGIEHIESYSIQGMGMLKLYFHPGTDIAQSMAQVTAMTFRATAFMPPGTLPAFIVRFDAGSIPVGQLVFSSDTRSDAEIQDLALYKVRPLLATLPGVSAPPPSGGKIRTIVVYADPARMRAYRISPDEIAATLARENLTLPAGNVRVGDFTTIASTNAMVNVPRTKEVLVVDRQKRTIISRIPLGGFAKNYPMSLDEGHHRLFVGVRAPARLLVLDTQSGQRVADVPCVGDTDDLFYDWERDRVYVIGGEGFVDVFDVRTPDRPVRLARLPTVSGARTGLWSPELKQLFVAAPHRDGHEATIHVYEAGGT